MDVTVSHLNNRLALQLPPELPLGLVFVVGGVEQVDRVNNGRSPQVHFILVEQAYRVNCVLSPRAASEVVLQAGMTVRAGGHLAFDPQWAGYYLLVRDVEIVQTPPAAQTVPPPETDLDPGDRTAVAAILADIKKRSDAANLAQADLPPWVQKIAPPEIQAEMEEALVADQEPIPPPASTVSRSSASVELDAGLLARLSAAMDSEEDVELTPDMLEDYAAELAVPAPLPDARPYDVPPPTDLLIGTAVSRPAVGLEEPEAVPTGRRGPDYFLLLLIFAFILVAVVLIVAIIMTL